MRIVRRPQFLALPPGTVFMRYRPCVFDGLQIKGETVGDDFTCTDLIGAVAWGTSGDYFERCELMEKGRSFPANFEAWGRDLQFESDDQLFAIYTPKDVDQLILALRRVRTSRPAAEDATWAAPQDGVWDGTYAYQLTAPHLSSAVRGKITLAGDKALDHRTKLNGLVEVLDSTVVIRWSDKARWSIHRASTGAFTVIADGSPARIVREYTS